ncbi:GCN5 family acetyltransferase [Methanococcoides methylutens]|uniref:GCN5 family acetyltransferase n=1 Tax=Methanococcoides methylutens TaxID=2226 RepID=A0A099SY67_METMT|nr:GNAT family protein [Methanococcoides methylutens]KGK97847.1 GCN5 family acetyltransferase [Methanococcoides methylutens]
MKLEWSKDNIVFSYCTEADLKEIAEMLSKESVCKYMFFGPTTEEDTIAYFSPLISSIEGSLKEDKIPHINVFTIREKDTGKFIGQCALFPIEFTNGNYLIGYQIDDSQWRKGYGSAACEFLVYYAFNVLDAFRITGDCTEGNVASEKTMRRSGFQSEGRQRKYWSHNGKWHDRLLFALLKKDISKERMEALKTTYQ